jgi:hypothetical protein
VRHNPSICNARGTSIASGGATPTGEKMLCAWDSPDHIEEHHKKGAPCTVWLRPRRIRRGVVRASMRPLMAGSMAVRLECRHRHQHGGASARRSN